VIISPHVEAAKLDTVLFFGGLHSQRSWDMQRLTKVMKIKVPNNCTLFQKTLKKKNGDFSIEELIELSSSIPSRKKWVLLSKKLGNCFNNYHCLFLKRNVGNATFKKLDSKDQRLIFQKMLDKETPKFKVTEDYLTLNGIEIESLNSTIQKLLDESQGKTPSYLKIGQSVGNKLFRQRYDRGQIVQLILSQYNLWP